MSLIPGRPSKAERPALTPHKYRPMNTAPGDRRCVLLRYRILARISHQVSSLISEIPERLEFVDDLGIGDLLFGRFPLAGRETRIELQAQ